MKQIKTQLWRSSLNEHVHSFVLTRFIVVFIVLLFSIRLFHGTVVLRNSALGSKPLTSPFGNKGSFYDFQHLVAKCHVFRGGAARSVPPDFVRGGALLRRGFLPGDASSSPVSAIRPPDLVRLGPRRRPFTRLVDWDRAGRFLVASRIAPSKSEDRCRRAELRWSAISRYSLSSCPKLLCRRAGEVGLALSSELSSSGSFSS